MDALLPGTPIPNEDQRISSQVSLKSQESPSKGNESQLEIRPPSRSEQISSFSIQRSKLNVTPPATSNPAETNGNADSINDYSAQLPNRNSDVLQESNVGNKPSTSRPTSKLGFNSNIGSRASIRPFMAPKQNSIVLQRGKISSRPTTASSTKSASSLSSSRSSLSSRSTKSSLESVDGRLSFVASVTQIKEVFSEAHNLLSLDNFVNKNKKFVCVSCNNILQFPVLLSHCDHSVCSSCLSDLDKGISKCPVDGKKIVRKEVKINRQLTKKLNSQSMSCPLTDIGCNWTGIFKEYKDHFDVCEYKQEACPNGCGTMVSRKAIRVHTDRECTKRHVMCRFCVRAVKAEVEIEHMKICPRFPVTCPKDCGESEIAREDLQEHIEEKCKFRLEKCPYLKLGCKFSGMGEEIELHLIESNSQHSSLIRDKLSTAIGVVEKHSLSIQEHERILVDQTKKLTVLTRIYGSQMLWKIDEWSKRRSDAISGKKTVLRSPPFYTGKYEYKLALSLLPNGDGTAKSRYMSLYMAVCKGEYDALLKWPFRMTVTLSLVDQCQNPIARKDHTYTLKPNPCDENAPFLGRPKNGPNLSFGAQNFILCETLSIRDYVRDDVIFIRVRVEEEDS